MSAQASDLQRTGRTLEKLSDAVATVYPRLKEGDIRIALVSRMVADQNNVVQFDPNDMAGNLDRLLADSEAAADIATLISGTDLTTSGVLTTLATNVGAHNAQGVTLWSALIATTGALTSRTLTTPVIASGVTASGSGANDLSGSSGTFKTSTGLVTIGGKEALKTIATPVAAAGSTAGDAAALGSANVVTISSDSAAKGVKLQTGVAGDIVRVMNTSATAAILYSATGGTINGLSANAGVLIPASKGTLAICTAADTWTTFDMAAHSTAA